MHELYLKEILTDVEAYCHHNGPRETIDHWSKEQLAFAIDDLVCQRKLLKEALAAELKRQRGE